MAARLWWTWEKKTESFFLLLRLHSPLSMQFKSSHLMRCTNGTNSISSQMLRHKVDARVEISVDNYRVAREVHTVPTIMIPFQVDAQRQTHTIQLLFPIVCCAHTFVKRKCNDTLEFIHWKTRNTETIDARSVARARADRIKRPIEINSILKAHKIIGRWQ